MRPSIRKKQDIDSFINDELEDLQDNTRPKPTITSNLSVIMAAKKPNAFAKPTFGIAGSKKGAINEDEIEADQIVQHQAQSFISPLKPPSSQTFNDQQAYQDSEAKQPGITDDSRRVNVTPVIIKKGPAIFLKPNLPKMKKFQMEAPDQAETDKFDKVIVQQVKQQDLQRENSYSALKKHIEDKQVAPIAMLKQTQAELAYVKQNPRPPSVAFNKGAAQKQSDDEYSDDGNAGFDEEGEDDDLKLEKIRKAMARENQKAQIKAYNGQLGGATKVNVVKQGPVGLSNVQKAGKFQVSAAQLQEEEIQEQLATPAKNKLLKPQAEPIPQVVIKKLPVAAPNALPTVKNSLPTVKLQANPSVKQNTANIAAPPSQQSQQVEKPQQIQKQNFEYQEPPKKQQSNLSNLEGFAKQSVLLSGQRVDHLAANNQKVRAAELKELIQLEQEEFFNVFEMVPQTAQDIYFQKLTAGTVKTAIVSCSDDHIERDIQTEDLGAEHKFTQAPDDLMSGNVQTNHRSGVQRRTKKNEALQLEKFISRAGPVMEQLLDENDQLRFMENRGKAAKHNAVEAKEKLKFPDEILVMLGKKNEQASIERVTCVHIFETMPQSKCAIAYEIMSPRHSGLVYVILIFSTTANQILRILRAESEVTQMCTPQDDQILIVGTGVGSLCLFDLADFESQLKTKFFDHQAMLAYSQPNVLLEKGELEIQQEIKKIASKFRVLTQTFQSDCLPNYSHFSPIRRLKFVSKVGSGPAQIGAMDELGVVSSWSVVEVQSHNQDRIGVNDLNLNLGGRFKLMENYSENLIFNPDVFDCTKDIAQSMELEFDPTDHNIFYFSSSESLFKCNRRDSNVPVRLNTDGLGSPSAMSMSDSQYLLVGFTCGSIALFHNQYLSPVTIWYQACKYPIMQLSWCWLFFNSENALETQHDDKKRFMTRMCEFFVIDKSEQFYVFNLSKSLSKSAHVINFAEKHQSHQDAADQYRISMTCADQTFYTSFLLRDNLVQLYMMNFKKGSQITKDKLSLENQKSANLLKTLPLNMDRQGNEINA